MAIMPGVDYRPINYAGVPRMTAHDSVCVHTIVGNDPAPAAHFSVRSDGHITQNRDTFYQSAANYQGNWHVVAIENDDHDANTPADNPFPDWGGSDVPAMTDAQCEANARIMVWVHQVHGVPLTLCPDSKPTSRGVAYHRLGIDGNWAGYAYGGRVSGGEHWSTSQGKVCPGDRRIKQTIEVILPRARVLAGLDVSKGRTDDMIITCMPGEGSSLCGILSGGVLLDISADSGARASAQGAIDRGIVAEIKVTPQTWGVLFNASLLTRGVTSK